MLLYCARDKTYFSDYQQFGMGAGVNFCESNDNSPFKTTLLIAMQTTLFHLHGDILAPANANECGNAKNAQLVLCFASKEKLNNPGSYASIRKHFPSAQIAMCSTAGEIFQESVQDDSLIAAALHFDSTGIETATVNIFEHAGSYEAAQAAVKKLPQHNLSYILVFSDGSTVNGSELVKGLNDAVEDRILITGGLAGDGVNFVSTLVGLNRQPSNGNIVVIGFYGEKISVTHGSHGGWDTFCAKRSNPFFGKQTF
ncbi:MAG: FIST N-terminal domain-containing protein [Agriterribacter sp.]